MAGETKYVEVYRDKAGDWRWRKMDTNGANVATSGQSFDQYSNAVRAAHKEVEGTTIEVKLPDPEHVRE